MTEDPNKSKESSGEFSNSEKSKFPRLHTCDMAGLSREIQKFIIQNPTIFGAADMYIFRLNDPLTLAGVLTAVLTGLMDSDRRPAVHKFVVVVPPELATGNSEEPSRYIISSLIRG